MHSLPLPGRPDCRIVGRMRWHQIRSSNCLTKAFSVCSECGNSGLIMCNMCNGITWDPDDLASCKQALSILLQDGISLDELSELDFGNLDVYDVVEQYYEYELNSFEIEFC